MRKIVLCIGSSCFARGNARNVRIAEEFLRQRGLVDEVDVDLRCELCTERCSEGPVVIIDDQVHRHVDTDTMNRLLQECFPDDPSTASQAESTTADSTTADSTTAETVADSGGEGRP